MSEPVRLWLCQPQQLPPYYGMYIIMYVCSYIASYVHVAIIHRVHNGIPVGSYSIYVSILGNLIYVIQQITPKV